MYFREKEKLVLKKKSLNRSTLVRFRLEVLKYYYRSTCLIKSIFLKVFKFIDIN